MSMDLPLSSKMLGSAKARTAAFVWIGAYRSEFSTVSKSRSEKAAS
jgi:hypothetical protein